MSSPADPSTLASRVVVLEEHVAHLEQAAETLSSELVTQTKQLEGLSREVQRLTQLVRDLVAASAEPPGDLLDEKPPHY